MSGKEKKIVKIDPGLHHTLDMLSSRIQVPIYVIVERAIKSHLSEVECGQTGTATVQQSIPTSGQGAELTEDQQDILALLADPRKDFLFATTQSTVTNALKQYREKWKPKEPPKKKAAKPRTVDERRNTGTR